MEPAKGRYEPRAQRAQQAPVDRQVARADVGLHRLSFATGHAVFATSSRYFVKFIERDESVLANLVAATIGNLGSTLRRPSRHGLTEHIAAVSRAMTKYPPFVEILHAPSLARRKKGGGAFDNSPSQKRDSCHARALSAAWTVPSNNASRMDCADSPTPLCRGTYISFDVLGTPCDGLD